MPIHPNFTSPCKTTVPRFSAFGAARQSPHTQASDPNDCAWQSVIQKCEPLDRYTRMSESTALMSRFLDHAVMVPDLTVRNAVVFFRSPSLPSMLSGKGSQNSVGMELEDVSTQEHQNPLQQIHAQLSLRPIRLYVGLSCPLLQYRIWQHRRHLANGGGLTNVCLPPKCRRGCAL